MRKERIEALNDWEFVTKLRNTAYIPQDNEYAYMRNYAKWAFAIDDNVVTWQDPERFVADLISHGYLKVANGIYEISPLDNDEPILLPLFSPDKLPIDIDVVSV